MQACQFCGAKSWGPVKADSTEQTPPVVVSNDPGLYRECDSCHAYALASLVLWGPGNVMGAFPGSHTVLDSPFGIAMMPGPAHSDPIASATALLRDMGVGKKPYQTRTYELVRDLLTANPRTDVSNSSDVSESSIHYAQWLVTQALLIEDELDRADKLDQKIMLPAFEMKPRSFQTDFAGPAIAFLSVKDGIRVGLALDCAIAYGALEAQTGNESLKLSPQLEQAYWEKVVRLKASLS